MPIESGPGTRRFLLLTSAHVCNNPRLVKEADALTAAGHDVRVVAVDSNAELSKRDETVMAARRWRLTRVPVRRDRRESRRAWLVAALAQLAARRAFDVGVKPALVRDQALSRFGRVLARAACTEPADVIVAHNLEALPPAVTAARRLGARLVFDFEDLYDGVLPDLPEHAAEQRLVRAVEHAYVRQCDALLAASEGIADLVAANHGVARPTVVLNTFGLASAIRPGGAPRDRVAAAPSLYWFSQVIGPGRGLEEVIDAVALLGREVELHLRGAISAEYRHRLTAQAQARGVAEWLHLHSPVPPDELVWRAAEHDVGLAPEQPTSRNHEICVSNKILTYLAAGNAVAATGTSGQREIIAAAPGAGACYRAGDAAALATVLRNLLASDASLRAAKDAARRAAECRFSWECESGRLLDALESVAAKPLGARPRGAGPALESAAA